MNELVCVGTFRNRFDAEFAKATLAAEGIYAIVSADDAGGWYPPLSFEVRVSVLAEDAREARALLQEPD